MDLQKFTNKNAHLITFSYYPNTVQLTMWGFDDGDQTPKHNTMEVDRSEVAIVKKLKIYFKQECFNKIFESGN